MKRSLIILLCALLLVSAVAFPGFATEPTQTAEASYESPTYLAAKGSMSFGQTYRGNDMWQDSYTITVTETCNVKFSAKTWSANYYGFQYDYPSVEIWYYDEESLSAYTAGSYYYIDVTYLLNPGTYTVYITNHDDIYKMGYTLTVSKFTHYHDYTYDTDTYEADCDEGGYTSYECKCGEEFEVSDGTLPLGHKEVDTEPVAPTCTSTGKGPGTKCFRCGKIVIEPEIIAKLPHTQVKGEGVAATCTSEGKTDVVKCSVCDEEISSTVVPKAPHTRVKKAGVAATCTSEGTTDVVECAVCGEGLASTVVPKADHVPVPSQAFVPATCTSEGKTTGMKCATCDTVLQKPQSIPKLDHLGVAGADVAATCTKTGKTDVQECQYCGEELSCTVVPKLAHTMGDWFCTVCGAVDATQWVTHGDCSATGADVHYFLDAAGTLHIVGKGAVKYRSSSAFWSGYMDKIKKVIVYEGVTGIGEDAFYNAKNLTTVVLADTVRYIDPYAFYNCDSLTTINLPDSVTYMDSYVFYDCDALKEIDLPDKLTKIPTGAFKDCDALTSIHIPASVTSIGTDAFYDCDALAEVRLEYGLESIEDKAFYFCTALTAIEIPDSVTDLGEWSFGCCDSLKSAVIGSGVTFVPEYAFQGSGLTDLSMEAVVTIDSKAFAHTKLSKIVLPDCLETLGSEAFYYCPIKEVYMGSKIDMISSYALYAGNTNAANSFDVYYDGTSSEWDDIFIATGNWKSYWNITYRQSGIEDGLTWALAGQTLTITGSGEIPYDGYNDWASWYENRARIRTVIVEADVTKVYNNAFRDYGNVNTIIFENDAPEFNESAFYNVTATVYYPLGNTTWTEEVRQNYGGTITWVAQCDHTETEILPAVAATCTETGLEAGAKCTTCGKVITVQKIVRAKGHTTSTITGTAATCTETGLTDGVQCTVCGLVTKAQTTIPATGHAEAAIPGSAPTCTAVGYTSGKQCSVCAAVLTQPQEIPALGHTEVTTQGKEATCGNTGLTEGVICSVCNEAIQVQEVVPIVEHTFGEWTLVEEATCTADGSQRRDCANCDHYETAVIAATGHSLSNGVCTVCGHVDVYVEAPVVKASNVASTGKIKLSWNKVEGAAKYRVYRSTSKNGTYSLLTTTSKTSVTNTSAVAGKTYYYYVVAVSADAVVSEKSGIVNRTCDLARPTVTLSNVASSGKIKISWTKVEGAVKYEVYRATSKNGTYTKLSTTTKTSITNTSAKAGKTYYYKVKAIAEKSAANSAYSSVKSRMCDLARPTASVARNSKGKPVVSWKAVTGAVKYKVYIYNSDGELIKTSTTTKLKLTHSSAVKGSTYTYRVVAVASNSSANSAKSTAVKIKSK